MKSPYVNQKMNVVFTRVSRDLIKVIALESEYRDLTIAKTNHVIQGMAN